MNMFIYSRLHVSCIFVNAVQRVEASIMMLGDLIHEKIGQMKDELDIYSLKHNL